VPGDANGFEYDVRRDGEIVITHHGKRATVLRGPRGQEFLAEVESLETSRSPAIDEIPQSWGDELAVLRGVASAAGT
jgi:hypothetical protein